MKRSQFTDQQVSFILRQSEEGTAVEEVCRKAGISILYHRSGGSVAFGSPPPGPTDVPLDHAIDPPGAGLFARVAGVPIALPDQPMHRSAVLELTGQVRQRVGAALKPGPKGKMRAQGQS